MKLTPIICAAALVVGVGSASNAWTPDMVSPYSATWDFSNGLQGWTISGNGSWVDPGTDPLGPGLPDGAPSGGGAGNLYLPDGSRATLDVSALNIGWGAGLNGFQLIADIYVPNLRPLTGFTFGYPGNMVHNAGLGVARSDGREVYINGHIDRGRMRYRDRTWDNTDRGPNWVMEGEAGLPDQFWWDQWITVAFDYDFSSPGKANAAIYVPWDSAVSTAGWITLATDIDLHPSADQHFTKLILGQLGGGSWTQAQFDNVRLTVVPEPGSIVALGAGLIGMAGMIRRKR